MRQIKGASAATHFHVCAVRPNVQTPDRVDLLALEGYLGVERVRLSGNFGMALLRILAGRAAVADSSEVLLEQFCSSPLPTFSRIGSSERAVSILEWGDAVGRESARDIVIGAMHRKALIRSRAADDEPYATIGSSSEVPVRRLVIDLLIHRDAYPNCLPLFRTYFSGIRGAAYANDSSREYDRIHVDCDMQSASEEHVGELITPEIPFHREMLRTQFDAVGWNLPEFRAFRVKLDYPIFGAQANFVIPLPTRPE